MRYLIYARKSSESDDKQAQSIDDQLKELRFLAHQRGLEVIGEFTEARSAKDPGGRPVFAQVVSMIQSGLAEGILCWHVNRLFRNPVDFGTLSWLLQTGALKEIYTPHQVHRTGDNVLLLSVENGMANQYILDLKKAVRRGLNSKIEKGWYPHKAPEGYLNKDGMIVPDPERFPRVRKVWDMALSGEYSVQKIREELERWGYRTKRYKRTGGTLPSRATLYNLLGNLFYAGYFVRAGETHKGAHEPMVTLEEFFRVQKVLKKDGRRYRKHRFAFNGLIRCGHCGCAVVGEVKNKRLADGTKKTYTYYSCSNAKRTCRRKVIGEGEIERQISQVLEAVSVPEELVEVAERAIERWRDEEQEVRKRVKEEQHRRIGELDRKMDRLVDLKLEGLLDGPEFLRQKEQLQREIMSARIDLDRSHERADAEWENVTRAVAFLHYGRAVFEGGTPAAQHLIAETLGAQYVLTDRRLAIELHGFFGRVSELKQEREIRSESGDAEGFEGKCLTWWGIVDAIRTGLWDSQSVIPLLLPLQQKN